MLDWIALTEDSQLDAIKENQGPVIIFKHSTRCSVSSMVKRGLEGDAERLPSGVPVYYLDLIKYRELSNRIVDVFHVRHESPQVLLIENGSCRFSATHDAIDAAELSSQLLKLQ